MSPIQLPAIFFQRVVGLMLLLSWLSLGQGIAQESVDALGLDQESSIAEINALAAQYYQGDGVPKSYSKAAELFLKAAGMGSAIAQYNVGYMYGNGLGLPSDYNKAYVFYHAAALKGYRPALEPLENLRQFMSAEKINEAENASLSTADLSSLDVSSLQKHPPLVNQEELRTWLQGIQPAAGQK